MVEKVPEATPHLTEAQQFNIESNDLELLVEQVGNEAALREAVRAEQAIATFIETELRQGAEGSTGWVAGELRKMEGRLAMVRSFIIEHTSDPIFLKIRDLQRLAEKEGSASALRHARLVLERLQSIPGEIEQARKEAKYFSEEEWLTSKADIEQYMSDLEAFIAHYDEDEKTG